MICERSTILSFTEGLRKSRKRYLSRASSPASVERETSKGSAGVVRLPSTSTFSGTISISPVGSFSFGADRSTAFVALAIQPARKLHLFTRVVRAELSAVMRSVRHNLPSEAFFLYCNFL